MYLPLIADDSVRAAVSQAVAWSSFLWLLLLLAAWFAIRFLSQKRWLRGIIAVVCVGFLFILQDNMRKDREAAQQLRDGNATTEQLNRDSPTK
jgi:lipopolysaccharide export LptBFGC system permease protein LptF